MKKRYNIFDSEGEISRDQLKAYLKNELSETDRNAVERTALDSEFDSDALDGFESAPDSHKAIDQLASKNPFGEAPSTNAGLKVFISAVAAISIGVFVFFIYSLEQESVLAENKPVAEKNENNSAPETPFKGEESANAAPEKQEENEKPLIDPESNQLEDIEATVESEEEPIPIPEEDYVFSESRHKVEEDMAQELSEPIAENAEDIQVGTASANYASVPITTTDNLSGSQELLSISDDYESEESTEEEIAETLDPCSEPGMDCILGYAVVDYDSMYSELSKGKTISRFESGSLPPAYESEDARVGNSISEGDRKILLSYDDVLKKGIDLFSRNKYSRALEQFSLILGEYPNDENAKLYSGLSYENLQNYNQAIYFFEPLITSEYPMVQEVAEWHLANSYVFEQRIEEAKQLLHNIASSDSFYSAQAEELLKTL